MNQGKSMPPYDKDGEDVTATAPSSVYQPMKLTERLCKACGQISLARQGTRCEGCGEQWQWSVPVKAPRSSCPPAVPLADILREADHIQQNGISLAKFGGEEIHEGRCRELCAMYLREFVQSYHMGKRLKELQLAGDKLNEAVADLKSALPESPPAFYCQAGGCESQCVNCADESPAALAAPAEGPTPRTDGLENAINQGRNIGDDVSSVLRLARQLERELAEAKEECRRLEGVKEDAFAAADGIAAAAKKRIAELESARSASTPTACNKVCEWTPSGCLHRLRGECDTALSATHATTPAEDYKALHTELIMAVARKWPGETRHQTALRYINEAENRPCSGPASAV